MKIFYSSLSHQQEIVFLLFMLNRMKYFIFPKNKKAALEMRQKPNS
jgi:hypothetical protein